ncbi:CCA tRNA nucleotidyltransferase [Silicimonas algicola]|uniref:Poly(A) polymerase n=1 Tax=Silicimonas algicola TaxID=1826607 RepID=A0A316G8G9_9RHOB|nr:CCA tRNA nucleotidyltransferase [Silicimonas algicola]AZQ69429.1 CCA tRNA nucleotidyltransferase [Silicimonas algicola]PWK56495.1 poly(A) polymerase [Silicimonas algicola]
MRIEADWLIAPGAARLFSLLNDAGYNAFAVGGCVRDAILRRPVTDVDLSTDARPERVMELAAEAGLHAVGTGIDHGTVTVVSEGVPYEITTFRRDVETDGRRAVVAFSDSLDDDARRRDFTMNALYADSSGEVVDPLGGLGDLRAGRVRFIEDAETRIREDYLRSLRYFRFHAWYGDPSLGFDPDALDAIARTVEGLETLSRERVGAEMKRLLAAPDPAPALAAMRVTGVLPAILPGSDDTALAPLVALESLAGVEPDALRRLAALGGDPSDALRLSRKETDRLSGIVEAGGLAPGEAGYRFGSETARDAMLVRAASLGRPLTDELETAEHGAAKKFPVVAADLMPRFEGHRLGAELKRLERLWIESGFVLDREALLDDKPG